MESKHYSKRIRYLRRLIVTTVVAACLIPTCICLIMAVRYDRLNTRYEQSMADLEWYRDRYGSEMEILRNEGTLLGKVRIMHSPIQKKWMLITPLLMSVAHLIRKI